MLPQVSFNMGFAIAGVRWFADTFVQGGSSVLQTKFSAKTHHHHFSQNCYKHAENDKLIPMFEIKL